MADTGWEGVWQPNVVGEGTLNELKDRAGEPQLSKSGKVLEWCAVNLRDGTIIYPAPMFGVRGGRY